MPVPITYDNVAGGSSEALLFAGIKFWLALRVPMRNDWIAKIQNNGGEVVILERMADMLIADDARPKHAPPNSYSWKFVDEAIKRGELPDKEAFVIQRPAATNPNAAGPSAGASVKTTRTAYTPEDDQVLTQYVRRRLDRAKANGIYEEFAKTNPRHTWQSWKDRWVKRLSLVAGNNVPIRQDWEDEDEDDVREAIQGPRHKNAHAESSAVKPPTVQPQRPSGPSSLAQEAPSPELSAPKPRSQFSPDEDDRLLQMIEETIRRSKAEGKRIYLYGNLLYEAFAKENPTHSARSWRARYKLVLAPRLEAASNRSPATVAETAPAGNTPRPHASNPSPQPQKTKTPPPKLQVSNKVGHTPPSPTPAQPPAAPERNAPAPRSPGGQASHSSAQALIRPRHSSPEADEDGDYEGEDDQAVKSSAGASREYEPDCDEEVGSDEEIEIDEEDEDGEAQEDQLNRFEKLIIEYEAEYPDAIDPAPIIRGEEISVWDLYRAFRSQNLPLDRCDWAQVAASLGFDTTKDPEVCGKVSECFQRNLEHFVGVADYAMSRWQPDDEADGASSSDLESEDAGMETAREHQTEQGEPGESQDGEGTEEEDEGIEEVLKGTKEEDEGMEEEDEGTEEEDEATEQEDEATKEMDEQPRPASSLSAAAAPKRRHEQAFHSDLSLLSGTPRKRARRKADLEIPDTPQVSHARPPPLKRQEILDSSPPARHMAFLTTSPTLPTRKKPVEPETQDWKLDAATQGRLSQTQDVHTDEVGLAPDGLDVSPSQQLRSEEDEYPVTPVPLLLAAVAEDARPPRTRALRRSHLDEEPADASTPKPRHGPSEKTLGKRPERREPSVSPPRRRCHVAPKSALQMPTGKRTLPAPPRQRRSMDSVRPSTEAPKVVVPSSSESDAPPPTPARPPKRTYAFGTQPRRATHAGLAANSPPGRPASSESLSPPAFRRSQRPQGSARASGPALGVGGGEDSVVASIVDGLVGKPAKPAASRTVQPPAERRGSEGRRAAAPPQPSIGSEVDRWVSLGYARRPITDLLMATCLSIPLLNQVIDENRARAAAAAAAAGGSEARRRQLEVAVPPDKRGVWTTADDRDLQDALVRGEEGARWRLAGKHGGDKALRRRWRFLADLERMESRRKSAGSF
ncbi:hypothetical protein GGTG_07529 [Gaeumannomyces tritici R3-111a-1]|uniref:Telomeric repeat-binding factor 2-interacting protein 1 n=1 Tax=Gaeumannomyces tritici (strain R3-111a-1) TaxID=644352 RepID=J3P1Y1_GAET3|nr:hypothetical protein GGTG_07529 [Gaeumannomyces tritici R3-111a-1]EJT73673.1 hypothetical protein GGTG_07529 [Gaeumannomyces tritici R3-111a-1]